jgi:hypothetical protein
MADPSRSAMSTLRRYRRREIRYTVVRDVAQDPYREIGCPQAVAALAAELVARHDDDREGPIRARCPPGDLENCYRTSAACH